MKGDLAEWLRAVLDRQELDACAAQRAAVNEDLKTLIGFILDDITAKRSTLDWLDRLDRWDDPQFTLNMPGTDEVRRSLALVYSRLDGYQDTWRP